MQQKIVITPKDLGRGLKIEKRKVVVDIDALNIPVYVKLAGVNVDKNAKKMTFEFSDGTTIEKDIADFLAVDTDTKPTDIKVENGVISLILSDGVELSADLDEFTDNLRNYVKEQVDLARQDAESCCEQSRLAIEELKNKKLKGEELVSLSGERLGYLVHEVEIEDEE